MGSRNQQTKVGKDHLVRGYWALSGKFTGGDGKIHGFPPKK
jgi:hypothetical protein